MRSELSITETDVTETEIFDNVDVQSSNPIPVPEPLDDSHPIEQTESSPVESSAEMARYQLRNQTLPDRWDPSFK